jgi:transposase-like protein
MAPFSFAGLHVKLAQREHSIERLNLARTRRSAVVGNFPNRRVVMRPVVAQLA